MKLVALGRGRVACKRCARITGQFGVCRPVPPKQGPNETRGEGE